jgi:hypothetical protein
MAVASIANLTFQPIKPLLQPIPLVLQRSQVRVGYLQHGVIGLPARKGVRSRFGRIGGAPKHFTARKFGYHGVAKPCRRSKYHRAKRKPRTRGNNQTLHSIT